MKKESNHSLFFLLGIGIIGLGLYYSASEDYGVFEIQLYHFICWIVVILALLRVLELMWKPVRGLWDYAWDKKKENTDQEYADLTGSERKKHSQDGLGCSHVAENAGQVKDSCKPNYEEPVVVKERGDSVIIMPDLGPRLSLSDKHNEPDRTEHYREYHSVPFEEYDNYSNSEVDRNSNKEKTKSKNKKKNKKKK